jgi:hypothetical protein
MAIENNRASSVVRNNSSGVNTFKQMPLKKYGSSSVVRDKNVPYERYSINGAYNNHLKTLSQR